MASEEITAKFRTFIENYHYEDLLNSVRSGTGALYIDFRALSKFDLELSEQLLEKFIETIESAEQAIKDLEIPEAKYPIRVRVLNLPASAYIQIRTIRSKHLGKLIVTDGLIRQASDVRPKVTFATFECPGCGAQILVEQSGEKFKDPTRCQCGRQGKFRLIDKKLVDVQRVVIEENPEGLEGGAQPKRMSIILSEDLLDPKIETKRYPGNKVLIAGVVKETPISLPTGGQSTKYDLLIEANSVQNIEQEFEELKVSDEERKTIHELAEKPNVYDMLRRSIAPSIYGHDNIKSAIVLQLFGGVEKLREDGTRTRGDIHVFLIGDPGSGKSEILKYVSTLAPKARYMAGKGSSAAGLTATVVKDEFVRGWALEAGALVLCNNGIACLDEMDKMSQDDTSAMHEALEQQTITISKANIHATLNARTTVLAAANPKFGRFDPFAPIANQIEIPPTLLNRFDLMFTIRDMPNLERDERIARHILELAKDPNSKKPEINIDLLRKFIAYARKNCKPKMTQSAIDEIKQFYIDLRSTAIKADEGVRSIPISARQLEALVRLSESSAKIRLSDKVTKKDAQRAISLLRSSMEEVAMDSETGKFDIDRIATGITATQRSHISKLITIIDGLTSKLGKAVPISDVLNEAESEGIDRAKAEEIIESLKRKGDIFEPKPGLVQKI